MGSCVQNVKLLVAHAIDQFRMGQQQRQQTFGQRRHGAAALKATHVIAAPAPFAFALFASAAFPVALLALTVALPAALDTPNTRGKIADASARRLVIVAMSDRLVVGVWRRIVDRQSPRMNSSHECGSAMTSF